MIKDGLSATRNLTEGLEQLATDRLGLRVFLRQLQEIKAAPAALHKSAFQGAVALGSLAGILVDIVFGVGLRSDVTQ